MKHYAITIAFACWFVASAQAEVIKPNDVRATSQFGLGLNIENLVNGDQGAAVGLTDYGLKAAGGAGVLDDSHLSNIPGGGGRSHGWISGCNDAGIAGGTPAGGCGDIFAVEPANEQIVEFEFDGSYDLTAVHIWNENDEQNALDRGVNEFELQVNPDRTGGTFTSIGTFNLLADDGFSDNFAQMFAISGNGIRRVRLLVNSDHGSPLEAYVGLAEVRFEGTLVTQDLAADGDKDGDVDGADFLIFQRGHTFGEVDTFLGSTLSATQSEGDYDNNNVVNGGDLAVWGSEFGQPSALSTVQSVPEPSTLLFTFLALVGGLLGRRPAFARVRA